MTTCASCYSHQGPFTKIMGFRLCKDTKLSPKRVSECLERRDKRMAQLYSKAPNLIG